MARIIDYRSEDGITGYRAGDVLHDTTTDTWSLAGRDGRGIVLDALMMDRRTGETCVGDCRLSALDVGFDLRRAAYVADIPANAQSVGLDIGPDTYLVSGPRPVLVAVAVAAGYDVVADDA